MANQLEAILQTLLKDGIQVASDEADGKRVPSALTFHRNGQIILSITCEGGDEMGGWMEYHHDRT